ncbi:MAG: PAS domain S-box protein [Pyrinomonadaceae bacterium]|nr:PAS domain S-box protein [Pyrinomonadaceae bacterium]
MEEKNTSIFGRSPQIITFANTIANLPRIDLDEHDIIVSCSPSAASLLGYHGRELVGIDFKTLLVETVEQRTSSNGEVLSRKDGSTADIVVASFPLRGKTGDFGGSVKILITDGLFSSFFDPDSDFRMLRSDVFVASIANELIKNSSLREVLQSCSDIMVDYLDAVMARIWVYNRTNGRLELQASSGLSAQRESAPLEKQTEKFDVEWIAAERKPHLTNDLLNDPHLVDREWATSEDIASFAGYPLIVGEQTVGVMDVFARRELDESTLLVMQSVSNGIANTIDRKIIETALLQSEEQYRIVAETASDAIFSISEDSSIVFANRAAESIFGYENRELVGHSLTKLMPQKFREPHLSGLRRYVQSGKRNLNWENVEVTGLHRDGSEFPIELSFGEYRSKDRRIFIGIARDVSERAKSEARVREQEQLFLTLANAVPQLVWMADPDGHIFWYNENWYNYTGTTPQDMDGWGWQAVHDPEMLPKVLERWKLSIRTGEPFEMQFPLKNAHGEFRWFLTRINPLRDENGKLIRWFGTNTDIDDQRRINERNRFIIRIDESVRTLETPSEIALTLARELGEFMQVDSCAYAEIQEDQTHFTIPGDYSNGKLPSLVGGYTLDQFGETVKKTLLANQPLIINDIRTDNRLSDEDRSAFETYGIRALIAFPLHKRNRIVASMSINHSEVREWRLDEIELVGLISNRFWESIERAKVVKDLQQSLEREQDARRAAEEASKIKDEFLATVSHELRTPLNAILGWSTLLRSGKLEGNGAKRAMETVERNARSQSQLIDDLLDISRIITGKLRLEVQTLELSEIIEAAVDAVRPAADAKEIRIQLLLDSNVGPVSGDADRLQQVFWNLLSNAVKFTPKGGRIQVTLERVNSHIEITIADSGKGIDPEFLPHIFDRFRQGDQTTTRRQGGLGLGLSIVRQLVEMHGGTVQVQSEGEGKGTAFTVSLPRLIANKRNLEPNRTHPTVSKEFLSFDCAPQLTDLRVLVVDDEKDARELLRYVLETCGSTVKTASSAKVALETLESSSFDILISDVGMPGEDGFALIKKIRELPPEKGGRLPAIALTAYARVEDRVKALTAGFQIHIPKPVEPVELIAVVASLGKRNSGSES